MRLILSLCFLFIYVCSLSAQNAKIDSLKKVIATTKVDTVKGRTLCRLCDQLAQIGDFAQTIEQGLEGARILERAQDHWFYSIALTHLAKAYRMQVNYPQALAYLQQCQKVAEKNVLSNMFANMYNEIGIVYDLMKDYSKALVYYQKALEQAEADENHFLSAKMLNNIGIIYDLQGKSDQALATYQRGLAVTQGLKDSFGIAIFLNNIGLLYHNKRDYARALEYYQKGLRLYEATKDQEGVSIAQINLANTYLHLGQAATAKNYAEIGYRLAQKIKNVYEMANGTEACYRADSALGNWKSAFEYHKLYKQYSDSLHNEDKAKEFGRIESKYQFEQEAEAAKRKEAETQRKDQLETDRRNNLQYLSIFAGLMVLFGGLAFIGKLKIPARVLDIALFAALLILFEFLLILSEPYIEQFSGGIPVQKLVFNSVIALGFAPLHGFLEGKLKKRFSSREE